MTLQSYHSEKLIMKLYNRYLSCPKVQAHVAGFADTLPMFKREYPGRQGAGGYSQQVLVKDILGREYDAHNVMEDVLSLLSLLHSLASVKQKINAHIMSQQEVANRLERIQNEKCLIHEYHDLVRNKTHSKASAKAIAASGLRKSNVELVHNRSGVTGLAALLKDIVKVPKTVSKRLHAAFSAN